MQTIRVRKHRNHRKPIVRVVRGEVEQAAEHRVVPGVQGDVEAQLPPAAAMETAEQGSLLDLEGLRQEGMPGARRHGRGIRVLLGRRLLEALGSPQRAGGDVAPRAGHGLAVWVGQASNLRVLQRADCRVAAASAHSSWVGRRVHADAALPFDLGSVSILFRRRALQRERPAERTRLNVASSASDSLAIRIRQAGSLRLLQRAHSGVMSTATHCPGVGPGVDADHLGPRGLRHSRRGRRGRLAGPVERLLPRSRPIHTVPIVAGVGHHLREHHRPLARRCGVIHCGRIAARVGLAAPGLAGLPLGVPLGALAGVVIHQVPTCARGAGILRAIRDVPAELRAVPGHLLLEPALAIAVVVLTVIPGGHRVVHALAAGAARNSESVAIVDVDTHRNGGERAQLGRLVLHCLADYLSVDPAGRQPAVGVPRLATHSGPLSVHHHTGLGHSRALRRVENTALHRLAVLPLGERTGGLARAGVGRGSVAEAVEAVPDVASVGCFLPESQRGTRDIGVWGRLGGTALHRATRLNGAESSVGLARYSVRLASASLPIEGVPGITSVLRLLLKDSPGSLVRPPGLVRCHGRHAAHHPLAGGHLGVGAGREALEAEALGSGAAGVAGGGPALVALEEHRLRERASGATPILALDLLGVLHCRQRRAHHGLAGAAVRSVALHGAVCFTGSLEGAGSTGHSSQGVPGVAGVGHAAHRSNVHQLLDCRGDSRAGNLQKICRADHWLAHVAARSQAPLVGAEHGEGHDASRRPIRGVPRLAGVPRLRASPQHPSGGLRLGVRREGVLMRHRNVGVADRFVNSAQDWSASHVPRQ
mmetsp:Transcript_3243/g.7726  ORF Transcript_3243/g.7726 Transcript_3243/m.7726 type:complete len:820 (-) Transcript_3243:2230-4689(-)